MRGWNAERGKGGNATSVSDNYSPEGLRNVGTLRQPCPLLSSGALRRKGQTENRSEDLADPPGEQHEEAPPHVALTSENIGPPCRPALRNQGVRSKASLGPSFPFSFCVQDLGTIFWRGYVVTVGRILIWDGETEDLSHDLSEPEFPVCKTRLLGTVGSDVTWESAF